MKATCTDCNREMYCYLAEDAKEGEGPDGQAVGTTFHMACPECGRLIQITAWPGESFLVAMEQGYQSTKTGKTQLTPAR